MAQNISPETAVEQAVDDLTRVVGIGPAVERHLHEAGIENYAQLAGLKTEDVAGLLKGMIGFTEKRIVEEDWLGQAQQLAEEAGEFRPAAKDVAVESSENSKHRQHYAVFTCELLLDRLNQVRRTRVMHVQSQQEVAWAGWMPGKLESFLAEYAQLNINRPLEEKGNADPVREPNEILDLAPDSQVKDQPKAIQILHGMPQIRDLQLCDLEGEKLGVWIPAGQPFSILLILDLQQVTIDTGERLRYAAEYCLRDLENEGRLEMNRAEGTLDLDKLSQEIEIHSQPLSPGDYRLDALVMLWPQSHPHILRNQLSAMVEGIWVHCYESGN